MARRSLAAVAAAALLATTMACSDDDEPGATTDPTRQASGPTTSSTADEESAGEAVDDRLLTVEDLPPGFEQADEVDDTITSFCVSEDATAGLSASARAATAFARQPQGMSVVQLVFRFEDGGANRFVEQADAILERCQEVPDFSGLAFSYEPVSADVAAALERSDSSTARFGTSVGSEELLLDVAVFAHGDVAQLVAVLGVGLPREELDTVAAQVFEAATARATSNA